MLVPGVLTPPAEGPQAVWYRRSFYLPTSWTGQRLVLRVGGARFTQKVYVNGRRRSGRISVGSSPASTT